MDIKNKKSILSIGINNYVYCVGGTNKMILEQQKKMQDEGITYIYINSLNKRKRESDMWNIIVDNRQLMIKNTDNLLYYLKKREDNEEYIKEIYIHNVSRVLIKKLDILLSYIDAPIKFYLHDYYTLCTNTVLLREDYQFCGCEEMSEEKCEGCGSYQESILKINQIKEFFIKYKKRIIFIAPSEEAKRNWLTAYSNFEDSVKIIEHQLLVGEYKNNKEIIPQNNKIKVAFIGEMLIQKGWNIWEDIFINNKHISNQYDLYYFGSSKTKYKDIKYVRVDFRNEPDAMTKALRQKEIDCVILWSIWPETYSYTYYESFSANCFIVTNPMSGNIFRQVLKYQNGIVIKDARELKEMFEMPEKLYRIINDYKRYGKCGPDKLIPNNEIINDIKENTESVFRKDISKRISGAEFVLTFFYKLKQIYYLAGRRCRR